MDTATQPKNAKRLSRFKKRLLSSDYIEVVQHSGQCALEGEYHVKRHGKLLAIVEALHVDDAIEQTKKMFNKEVVAVI